MQPQVGLYSCGHSGRGNETDRTKTTGFIRVAEIRQAPVIRIPNPCPECKRGGKDAA